MSVTGEDDILRAMNKFGMNADAVLRKAVYATANNVRNNAVRSIQKQTMGNVYSMSRQGGGVKEVTAGKVGEAPNTQTGRLVSSIAVEKEFGKAVAFVGTSVEYGKYLEFNNHPWLQPAADKESGKFSETLTKVVKKEMRRAQL